MSNHSDDSAPRWPNAAPSPADLIGAFTRPPDPRDAEIARLRADLARAEALNRINVCGYCHAQFQRTEDGVRQLAKHIICCERNPLAVALHRVADERDEARAQLAAAQADNAALRERLSQIDMARVWCDSDGQEMAAMRSIAREALATPAPGAPLLDAVRDLEAAATGWHNAECPGIDKGLPLGECCRQSTALAAVRAVLPSSP